MPLATCYSLVCVLWLQAARLAKEQAAVAAKVQQVQDAQAGPYIVHDTVHYIMHYIVHYIVHYTVHYIVNE